MISAEPQYRESLIYLAGLWFGDLGYGLLWFKDGFLGSERPTYQAPPWSWASQNGSIAFMVERDAVRQGSTFDARIAPEMHLVNDRFGAVTRGSLLNFRLQLCAGSHQSIKGHNKRDADLVMLHTYLVLSGT
jgi:hypothetical protein